MRKVRPGHARVDTSRVRSALVALLAGLALAVVSTAATASSTAGPTLRIATGAQLTVVGSGFSPRTLVRVHLAGPGFAKRSTVRTNAAGSFAVRFAGLETCALESASAITSSGARVRVPTAFFVRECPPPPPLAPGVYAHT